MKQISISASVSCMDLCNLGSHIKEIEQTKKISLFHFDVVDGHFNDCFILGETTLEQMRAHTTLPIEVHLAVNHPERYIERFAQSGADFIAVHYEAMENPLKIFEQIRSYGATPILAYRCNTEPDENFISLAKEVPWILKLTVNPGFSGQKMQKSSLDHIKKMRELLVENNLETDIQADGNINAETIPLVVASGATILTGGTSGLFLKGYTLAQNIENMLKATERI